MNRFLKHTILGAAFCWALCGCTKDAHLDSDSGNEIKVSAVAPTTKAMLSPSTFLTEGNRIRVYDFVSSETTPHINDLIGPEIEGNNYGNDNIWLFANGPHQWTADTHKFFGWLETDANPNPDLTASGFFGTDFGFNETTKVLTIPEKVMDASAAQFDFMYSNIVSRDMVNAADYSAVGLEFSHLFTALSIGLENSTSSYIKILDFKLENIPSTRSATINFAGNTTSVGYSDFKKDGETNKPEVFTRGLDDLKDGFYAVAPGGTRSNIFKVSLTEDDKEYMILWPIDANLLYSDAKIEIDEGVTTYPTSWKMSVKYAVGNGSTYGEPIEKRINFPNISLEAGKKYHYDIVFADKSVSLKVQVKPWEYEDQSIDYSTDEPSIFGDAVLKWNRDISLVDDVNKMVSIINAQAAKAQFTLQSPVGGSWIVSLVGDVSAFEVSPSSGIIDSQTATILVKPLIASPSRDYKVKLKFIVRRSDGRLIPADDVIQRGGIYTVVLPRNN